MDLIQDDQFVVMPGKVQLWLRELGPIRVGFEIEVEGRSLLSDFQGKRRLSHLTRPQQGNGGIAC
jgi:hypothetical protein